MTQPPHFSCWRTPLCCALNDLCVVCQQSCSGDLIAGFWFRQIGQTQHHSFIVLTNTHAEHWLLWLRLHADMPDIPGIREVQITTKAYFWHFLSAQWGWAIQLKQYLNILPNKTSYFFNLFCIFTISPSPRTYHPLNTHTNAKNALSRILTPTCSCKLWSSHKHFSSQWTKRIQTQMDDKHTCIQPKPSTLKCLHRCVIS